MPRASSRQVRGHRKVEPQTGGFFNGRDNQDKENPNLFERGGTKTKKQALYLTFNSSKRKKVTIDGSDGRGESRKNLHLSRVDESETDCLRGFSFFTAEVKSL